ncbi:MAG: folylpolyglutamate synthase/dihydrofolate synthase family protein [Planctomycetota bacterium]
MPRPELRLTKETKGEEARFPELYSRLNYERTIPDGSSHFKLQNMIDLASRLDNPHLAYPVIHVAGTKGKGSVSTMVGSVLSSTGMKTGVYTSPHLETVRQRMTVDGELIPEDDLSDLLALLGPHLSELDRDTDSGTRRPVTFFDVITTSAFTHFARSKVDAAVIEVGLGGRLDSTNICQPAVTIITNISHDHTRQLGDTLEEIAGEKAGIIKAEIPVISGAVNPDAAKVIRRISAEKSAPLYELDRDFHFEACADDGSFSTSGKVCGIEYRLEGLRTLMPGVHQIANAAVAVAALIAFRASGFEIAEDKIADGLSGAALAGRTEVINSKPPVILDMAHNVASISALVEAAHGLQQWQNARRRVLLIAISREKDATGMLRLLTGQFDEIVITKYTTNPRSREPEELEAIATRLRDQMNLATRIDVIADPAAAWNRTCETSAPDDFVCVTGSAFLIAELRPLIPAR